MADRGRGVFGGLSLQGLWRGVDRRRAALIGLLVVEMLCALFFIYDLFGGALGLRTTPIPWVARELIQIAALAGLILGVVVSAIALQRIDARRAAAEDRLATLSAAFNDFVGDRFTDWGLTPAERDVATFVIKGFSIQEIARLRETSDGTVKAQTAAIYRKAGVSGRAQLQSLFIEDLLDANLPGTTGPEP